MYDTTGGRAFYMFNTDLSCLLANIWPCEVEYCKILSVRQVIFVWFSFL